MSVIAACLYSKGCRSRDFDIDEDVLSTADPDEFVWIGVSDPTEEEMRSLQTRYRLHPIAVAAAMDVGQMPRLEVLGNELFAVARTAQLEGDEIRYGQTALFIGHRHLISVRHGSQRDHTALREQLESAPELLSQGVDYVLHAILNYIVDGYLPIFEMIEDSVLEMERRSLNSFLGPQDIARIFGLRCQLTRFQRTLGPMAELTRKLVRGHFPCISPSVTPYFNDVLDHVLRVQDMIDGLLQVLASVFEFSSLLEQQRTGAITRKLAAWAAILAVPTAITGIYGMNFHNIPELRTPYGYHAVVAMIVVLSGLLYLNFRRLKWI